ncbi:hypothetical protein MUN46_010055 [Mesosutterella sp. AGMB02718]|uniref:Uncharacterized protein n=1 Tax=Mesosutterella faecium TaxID=2925194 RepID=A0ABT7IPH5_9BURK|nr:hypothetical protein [Mesosutterella sp. AGMB02718]MDL2060278.1 hypothetical protein [Mesosutterella sp. AGMB02718]
MPAAGKKKLVRSAEDIVGLIRRDGFLPFFKNDIEGFSLEEACPPDLWYVEYGDGRWQWPVWDWKGRIISLGNFAYAKFFRGMGFVSERWFPDFLNYRRSRWPLSASERRILETLRGEDSLLLKELRALSGYSRRRGKKESLAAPDPGAGKLARLEAALEEGGAAADAPRAESFETALTRLQKGCWIVTADFEMAHDRNGRPYGWGLSRLTTPESFFGPAALRAERTPEESKERIGSWLAKLLPQATERQIERFIG